MTINKNSRIYIAGHKGMVGSALIRYFNSKGYNNLITKNKNSLDLLDQKKTTNFIINHKPDYVIIAAAKVGGILANDNSQAKFIYQNLMIQTNLIHASYMANVKKLIFLGSSCIYPKYSKQPISEESLLSGKLEKTNEGYAIAKIAGLKMCEFYNKQYKTNFLCLMPSNLYGPNDNYDSNNSHFFPALLKKIYEIKKKNNKILTIWGDGTPKRELLFVDDLAIACEFFLKKKTKHSLINIGSGKEKTILNFSKFLMKKIGVDAHIKFDKKKPNGTPRKILDSALARKYGWRSKFNLEQGFDITYRDFLNTYEKK